MHYPSYYLLLDIIIWNVLFFSIVWRVIKCHIRNLPITYKEKNVYRIYFLFFVLFAVFAFHTGDFRHYYEGVNEIYKFKAYSHMEEVYNWLVFLVKGNYYLWRLIVWSLFFILLYLTLKRMGTDNYLSLLFFVGMLLPSSVEGRYSLGMMILVYGFVLFLTSKGFRKILSCAIIIVSFFFHKSIILILLLIPLSFVKITKKRLVLMLLLFPVVLSLFNSAITSVFSQVGIWTSLIDEGARKAYFDNETEMGSSFGLRILWSFWYIVYIALLLFLVIRNMKNERKVYLFAMISLSFFICYASFVLYASVLDNYTVSRRYFMLMPYPLIPIVSLYLKENFISTASFKWMLFTFFVWQNYYMLLQMYYFS